MNYVTQTGLGKAPKTGVGAAVPTVILYVEHDPSGTMCPACTKALTWADANGAAGTIAAPAGLRDEGGYAVRFNDDPGMPAELLTKLASIGVNGENYPTADIGGTIVTGFDQPVWDKTVTGAGGAPVPPGGDGGGMSTGAKVALAGAGVLAAGALAYAATSKSKRKKHHRR